jgi:RNA polymerase sigma factor (sigma-70 family)
MEEPPDGTQAGSPLDDPGRWPELLDSVGIDSILVVVEQWMGPLLRKQQDAGDIVQQTLEHAWRDRAGFRWTGYAGFRAWLLSIAKHRIQDALDKMKAQKREGDATATRLSELTPDAEGSISSFLPGITTTPERLAYYKERAQIMRQALASLPPDLEGVVRLKLFEGKSVEEVFEALGISRATMFERFKRGSELYARKLAQLLGESGFDKKPKPP